MIASPLLDENVIPDIPKITKYWFVRTDGGQYFEAFYKHGFIGINWNYITLLLLDPAFEARAREMIAEKQGFDQTKIGGRTLTTSVYNKIRRFSELSKGDIVVIPSRGSNELAFGVIEDDITY